MSALAADLSTDEAAAAARVTFRMADYYCRAGVLGPRLERPTGSGNPRRWTTDDVTVLAAVGRVARAFSDGRPAGAGAASSRLLAEVAAQVRASAGVVRVRLAARVELTVDVTDLTAGARP